MHFGLSFDALIPSDFECVEHFHERAGIIRDLLLKCVVSQFTDLTDTEKKTALQLEEDSEMARILSNVNSLNGIVSDADEDEEDPHSDLEAPAANNLEATTADQLVVTIAGREVNTPESEHLRVQRTNLIYSF